MLGDIMTLITLDDSDVRMVALVDIRSCRGSRAPCIAKLPAGYEVSGHRQLARGPGARRRCDSRSATRRRAVTVPRQARAGHPGGSFSLETGLISIPDIQRERGEIASKASARSTRGRRRGLPRIDARELSPGFRASRACCSLRSAISGPSGQPLPELALAVKRLKTRECSRRWPTRGHDGDHDRGRALTEVRLRCGTERNLLEEDVAARPSMVSVEVAGERAKPAIGSMARASR